MKSSGSALEVASRQVDGADGHARRFEPLARRERMGRCRRRDRAERFLRARRGIGEAGDAPHLVLRAPGARASAPPMVPVTPVTRMRSPEITGTAGCRSRSGRAGGRSRDRTPPACSGASRARPAGGRRSTAARRAATRLELDTDRRAHGRRRYSIGSRISARSRRRHDALVGVAVARRESAVERELLDDRPLAREANGVVGGHRWTGA